MPSIRCLAEPLEHDHGRIKGSRFLALLWPVQGEREALGHLAAARERFVDATHHCWAWRLGPERVRSDDDGEPRGTAGEPILRRLQGADLVGVMAVVVRWYGGTKLGTGGLVRAYGGAVAEALERAEIVERALTEPVLVDLSYDLEGVVQSVLTAHGLTPSDAQYGRRVQLTLEVPVEAVDALIDDLGERSSGRVEAVRSSEDVTPEAR